MKGMNIKGTFRCECGAIYSIEPYDGTTYVDITENTCGFCSRDLPSNCGIILIDDADVSWKEKDKYYRDITLF